MEFPFKNKKTQKIMREVVECIPPKTKVYLVGGTLRNALYYIHFKKRLPQRDYDLVVFGDYKKFVKNLLNKGFDHGKICRKTQIVLKKRIKQSDVFSFKDFVYFRYCF